MDEVDKILAEQSTPNPLVQKLKEQAIAFAKQQLAANGITLAQLPNDAANSFIKAQVAISIADEQSTPNPLIQKLKEQAIALAKQQLAANGIVLAQVENRLLDDQSTPNPMIQMLKQQAIALAKQKLAEQGIVLAQVNNFNAFVMDEVDHILAEQSTPNPLVQKLKE